MRYYKTVAGLFMLVLICLAMAFYFSCMSSCQLMPEPLPIDYVWIDPDDPVVIPPDTTLVDTTQPVIIDTCETLIHYTDPAFTMMSTYFFHGTPLSFNWHYNQYQDTSLVGLLQQILPPSYTYTYYEANGGVSVIIDGISSGSLFQGKIWTYDLFGARATLTTCERCLNFYGSATPEQAITEAENRESIRSFHLLNTPHWTVQEETTFARACGHFPECKHGEYWASFRESEVPQPLIDSFDLFLWTYTVQSLTEEMQILALK